MTPDTCKSMHGGIVAAGMEDTSQGEVQLKVVRMMEGCIAHLLLLHDSYSHNCCYYKKNRLNRVHIHCI